MSESFQLILNSQGANVLDNANRAAIKYNINWASFLPKKYKKFHCQFVFKSGNHNANLSNGTISINMGQFNCSDGSSMSSSLGIIYPVVPYAGACYLNSTNNDNNDFWISYPCNQQITVKLVQFDGVTDIANVPHYVLIINFKGVPEDDDL